MPIRSAALHAYELASPDCQSCGACVCVCVCVRTPRNIRVWEGLQPCLLIRVCSIGCLGVDSPHLYFLRVHVDSSLCFRARLFHRAVWVNCFLVSCILAAKKGHIRGRQRSTKRTHDSCAKVRWWVGRKLLKRSCSSFGKAVYVNSNHNLVWGVVRACPPRARRLCPWCCTGDMCNVGAWPHKPSTVSVPLLAVLRSVHSCQTCSSSISRPPKYLNGRCAIPPTCLFNVAPNNDAMGQNLWARGCSVPACSEVSSTDRRVFGSLMAHPVVVSKLAHHRMLDLING